MTRFSASLTFLFAYCLCLYVAVRAEVSPRRKESRNIDDGQTRKWSNKLFLKDPRAPYLHFQNVHQQDVKNTTLESIRAVINAQVFTPKKRQSLLYNAIRVIEGVNPHLFIRNRFLNVNPVSAMRTFATFANSVSNFEFHLKMRSIFNSMNDGHTVYVPPLQLVRTVVTLGFYIESYFEKRGGARTYVFSRPHNLFEFDHPTLTVGAEIISIDGEPVEKMAARLGSLSPRANKASQLRSGTRLLTARRPAYHPIPDKPFATVRYISTAGQPLSLDVPWRYFLVRPSEEPVNMTNGFQPYAPPFDAYVARQVDHDMDNILLRNSHQSLWTKSHPLIRQTNDSVPSFLQEHYEVMRYVTDEGTFGYLKVKDFGAPVTREALIGLARIVIQLPKKGLILDVRDNPGGYVFNVVFLFELLSSKLLRPIPEVIRASRLTLQMTKNTTSAFVAKLRPATEDAVMFGEPFSGPSGDLLAYTADEPYSRLIDQQYSGPIVTLANAASASGGDLIVALSRDYNMSYVINVDGTTAGAGATVLGYEEFQEEFPTIFNDPLPYNISFTSAFIRMYRSLNRSGALVEYLGVEPDERYYYTRNDVLNSSMDLIQYSIEKLVKMGNGTMSV